MASKDLTHRILGALALPLAQYSNDADGETIDTQGFESVAFTGTVTGASAVADEDPADADLALQVEESDDATTWAAASADDLHNEALDAIDETTEDDTVFQIGYRGTKRYVRLSVVHTAGFASIAAMAVLGDPREAPTY